MWAGACAGELLGLRGGLECSDLDYLRSALDGKRGALERQQTKHVRTHTHKLKPLNHFTVVPHPLYPLRFNSDGDNFVLAITTTVRNRGVTVVRFIIQRATREVACVCYKMFFRRVLAINPELAPWHVRVAREVRRLHPSATDEPPAAVEQAALDGVRKMASSVLIGTTLDFSASLAGGAFDALVGVGFGGFSVDKNAAHLLFVCAAHANRLCDRAQVAVRSLMRRLMTCHNRQTAEKLREEVVAMAPGRDCTGVLGNSRLRPASRLAYSMAHHLQRAAASSTTNVEEALHERV